MSNRRLYLASASPRRAEILSQFSVPFHVIANGLENEPKLKASGHLRSDVKELARQKALASRRQYRGLILGVDTVVTDGKTVFGKPESLADAKRILRHLSGRTHQVITGFCLLDSENGRAILRSEVSDVTFKNLSQKQIDDYCRRSEVLDKAGGYAIQEIRDPFVARLRGSYFNVVGLPIHCLLRVLRNYAIVY